jgi:hypothetical protein
MVSVFVGVKKMAIAEKELKGGETSQGDRAWEIYHAQRAKIETLENIGKIIVIDTNSGDYEIAEDELGLAENQRLLRRHPDAALFGLRVGYEAVYSFDGGVERLP